MLKITGVFFGSFTIPALATFYLLFVAGCGGSTEQHMGMGGAAGAPVNSTGGATVVPTSTGGAPVVTSTGGATGSTTYICAPGETNSCKCTDGRPGAQNCQSDRLGWMKCECSGPAVSGTGGSTTSSTGGAPVHTGGSTGTGGKTGTGGASATGGASNTGGSTGTGGATATGGANGLTVIGQTKTYTITFTPPETVASNVSFAFTHYSPNDSTKFFDGQSCITGSKGVRTCTVNVDPSLPWQFYATIDGGKWIPGKDAGTQKGSTFGWDVTVSGAAAFKMVPNANGYQFRIEPNGTLSGSGDTSVDADGDGFTALQGDCDSQNPSRRPKASSETYAEVCGDGVDNDCNGGDLVCGSAPSTGTTTLTIRAFGINSGANPLLIQRFSPSYVVTTCSEVDRVDPIDGVSRRAMECIVPNVDRNQALEFILQAGNQWSTGYTNGGTTCSKFLRIYVYDGSFAVADYDDSSVTNFSQKVTDRYLSQGEGCHNILPRQ